MAFTTPPQPMSHKAPRGFIALISVSIIATVVLILCAVLSAHSFFTRTSLLSFENKIHSEDSMRVCVSYILQQLVEDATYTGNEAATVGGSPCIIAASTSGDPRMFTITTSHHRSYTSWQLTISLSTLDVLSRYEVP
jgi:hypothetical protein